MLLLDQFHLRYLPWYRSACLALSNTEPTPMQRRDCQFVLHRRRF